MEEIVLCKQKLTTNIIDQLGQPQRITFAFLMKQVGAHDETCRDSYGITIPQEVLSLWRTKHYGPKSSQCYIYYIPAMIIPTHQGRQLNGSSRQQLPGSRSLESHPLYINVKITHEQGAILNKRKQTLNVSKTFQSRPSLVSSVIMLSKYEVLD